MTCTVNNVKTNVAGLMFTLADSRLLRSKPKKNLSHALMMGPSADIDEKESEGQYSYTGQGGDADWDMASKKLNQFHGCLNDLVELKTKNLVESKTKKSGDEKVEEHGASHVTRAMGKSSGADIFLEEAEEDMRRIKDAANAAKIDIMTRIFQQKKKKRSRKEASPLKEYSPGDGDELALFCTEKIQESTSEEVAPSYDREELNTLIMRAAQDASVLQETARIIRRRARELACLRAKAMRKLPEVSSPTSRRNER
jgi:hypothetical protein